MEVRATDLLTTVATEDEAIEMCTAIMQLYREQGFYLERIYKWADRVGYDHIKEVIFDDLEQRQAYYERFVYSQKFAQVDPWAERVAGAEAHEFAPMAEIKLEAAE